MNKRRQFLSCVSALIPPLASSAQSFQYPDRSIRLVVPYPPGGPSDIVGRLLSDALRRELNQPLFIENRPGASGLIGTAAVANASPDGYTLLVSSRSNHVIAPLVQAGGQVDPAKDLVSIGLVLRAVGLFVTGNKSSINSIPELISSAKSQPGKLFYGSAGIGATNHISVEQFKLISGIDLTHIPYKGSGPMITALMSGEVSCALLDFASAHSGILSGSLIPLAQTSRQRLASLPNVQTFKELGFPNYDPSFWIGLAAPRGTHQNVINRLNKSLDLVLTNTELKARAQVNGWELIGGTPQLMDQVIKQDSADYEKIIKKLDIK